MWDQKKKGNPFGGGGGDDLDLEGIGEAPDVDGTLAELDAAVEKAKELEREEKQERERKEECRCCFC